MSDDELNFLIGDVDRDLTDEQVFAIADAIRAAGYVKAETLDVVFDGPPGPDGGRFVEVENAAGRSVKTGEWVDRGDGLWGLRIVAAPSPSGEETTP